MTDRKHSSILDELCSLIPAKDQQRIAFVESRAIQVIASARNLMNLLEENFDHELADELKRRLMNSIRTGDDMKFRRKMTVLKKDRNNDGSY